MSTVPTTLPGLIPLPGVQALPGSTPTPHDPSADPFLALLSQLVAPPTTAAAPGGAAVAPVATGDAESESDDGTAVAPEEGEAHPLPAVPVLPVLPVASLVVQAAANVPTHRDVAAPATPAIGNADADVAPAAGPVIPTVSGSTSPTGPEAPASTPAPPVPPAASATSATSAASAAAPAAVPVSSATSGPAAGPATGSDAPAPVARQVFPEVVRAAVSGVTPNRVVVRLQPEHLGDVRVVLRTDRSGTLEVSLAGGPEARAAIREGAPELRRMLEMAGSHDAKVVVRHLGEAAVTAPAAPPATAPSTTVRTDSSMSPGAPPLDAGAGGAGGTASGASHGEERRDRTPQDARPGAMDGIPDPTVEATRPAARRAVGLDVMM